MKIKNKLIAIVLLMVSQSLFAGEAPDDSDALKGVTKGKVIFDINMVEPKK